MAVLENAGVDIGSPARENLDRVVTSSDGVANLSAKDQNGADDVVDADGDERLKSNGLRGRKMAGVVKSGGHENGVMTNGGGGVRDIEGLAEMLTKLNPMAAEFVPIKNGHGVNGKCFGYGACVKRRNDFKSKPRMNNRTSMAQREEIIRRTVYVSDIDQQVTEEQLAALFNTFGQVVDCRVCGDPNSCLRFAFIEFTDEEGAHDALGLSGMMLGFYPVRVIPSKTAIAPVNPTLLPRSDDEREMCSRTVYCTNIDRKISQADVKFFFESLCGEVHRLRLLGDYQHPTRIAFVEFFMAESAIAALSCSGAILGSFPIRMDDPELFARGEDVYGTFCSHSSPDRTFWDFSGRSDWNDRNGDSDGWNW